ncbi:MAG: hypothetical protein GF308_04815 [Candidatus Heimdallarchaeota archaeon]|nr:hypothetical protein [Candidatus Heimdallarchaeota archaeon]
MKKINPKIVSIIILIMTILLAGGLAAKETMGPGIDPGPESGSGGG